MRRMLVEVDWTQRYVVPYILTDDETPEDVERHFDEIASDGAIRIEDAISSESLGLDIAGGVVGEMVDGKPSYYPPF